MTEAELLTKIILDDFTQEDLYAYTPFRGQITGLLRDHADLLTEFNFPLNFRGDMFGHPIRPGSAYKYTLSVLENEGYYLHLI